MSGQTHSALFCTTAETSGTQEFVFHFLMCHKRYSIKCKFLPISQTGMIHANRSIFMLAYKNNNGTEFLHLVLIILISRE